MSREVLNNLYKKYGLSKDDTFKHKHYHIIKRQGIDKIQALENITIEYDVIKCESEFCVVKAIAASSKFKIQTFGSAKKGGKINIEGKWVAQGNTDSWYVMEVAEKRAMSRAILKLAGFYELGVYGEDESEEFNRSKEVEGKQADRDIQNIIHHINNSKSIPVLRQVLSSIGDNDELLELYNNKFDEIGL